MPEGFAVTDSLFRALVGAPWPDGFLEALALKLTALGGAPSHANGKWASNGLWCARKPGEGECHDLKQDRNLRMESCGWKPRAEKGGRQPQPSLAWYEGNLGCEA